MFLIGTADFLDLESDSGGIRPRGRDKRSIPC